MSFDERLNYYIDQIGCSAKKLSEASGVSAAAVSRYRAGERVPAVGGEHLRLLAAGIAGLSGGRFDERAVLADFDFEINGITVDYPSFLSNLNALLEAFAISNNDLAWALNFDPSYISRILAGQRRPADLRALVLGVSGFVARRNASPAGIVAVSSFAGVDAEGLVDEDVRTAVIAEWLGSHMAAKPVGSMASFLEKLDSFDLNEFIRAIRFDEMKVPTALFQLPTSRTCTGIHDMMECEIAFLKAVVLSRSTDPLFIYSDMPLSEMAADGEFPKKWMYGMAMVLKKGLRLQMVHDTGRPLPEMMLGLESWIPMYMTGQVEPYYLESLQDGVFLHHLKVAGTVALSGEAIAGHHAEGRYYLTNNRDDVLYFRRRADRLLERARPLMHIYVKEGAPRLSELGDQLIACDGPTRVITSAFPMGVLSKGLVERVLERNGLDGRFREAVHAYAEHMAARLEGLLEHGPVTIEMPLLSQEEYEAYPASLELSGAFLDRDVPMNYDEYLEGFAQMRLFAESRPGCTLVTDGVAAFRNVRIVVFGSECALVSKAKAPTIHFAIKHPAMVRAFKRFEVPIVE